MKITNSQSQPQVVYPPDSPPFSSTPVLSWNECLSDQTTSYRAASSEVKYIWNSWSHRKETRPAPQKLRCRVLFTVMTRLGPEEYTVGWVCPLEVEQVAALEMLDEEHDRLPQHLTDHNIYHLGNIGKQNVVIAGLPDRGNNSAATVVTQMRTTFPNLRFGLLVGIGGGVPTTTDDGIVRLGDIVVSVPTSVHPGTVQYDRGKAEVGKFQRTGALDRPPVVLLNAVRELSVHRARSKQDPIMNNIKRIDTSIRGLRKYKYPGSAEDHLYRSDYVHLRPGLPCDECGCDPAQRIERYSGGNNHDREDEDSYIVVHRGTIASGEAVIKDGIVRDNLAKEYGILCFETEAAGALAGFHCITIRGISDYCDSHKNDRWHGYAAAAAAAYARELFFHMSITETRRYIPSTTENNIEFPENSQHEPEHLTIMKWLTPIEYASQHAEFVNIRQKRIGEWLLNTDKYREWERQNKKVLFYPGIPGADKTIIASLVVDHLSKIFQNDNEVGIAYIYCNHKRQEKQKPVDLLKSLLKQLIQRQPYLPPSVKTLYKQHKGRRSSPSLDEVSEAVHSVIANYSRAFIIIDALDEAQGPDGSRAMFMSEIYKLQVHTKANIFITSRYMHDIKEEIEGYTSLEIRW